MFHGLNPRKDINHGDHRKQFLWAKLTNIGEILEIIAAHNLAVSKENPEGIS